MILIIIYMITDSDLYVNIKYVVILKIFSKTD